MVIRTDTIDIAAFVLVDQLAVAHTFPLPAAATSREALREGLRQAIQLGVLPQGSRLRAAKDIAREVGLGSSTVSAAIQDLTFEGLIERSGKGPASVRRHGAVELVRVTPRVAELLLPFSERRGLLEYAPDLPDCRRYDQQLWGRTVARVSIICDPRWWSPVGTMSWAKPLGPAAPLTRRLQVQDTVDSTGAWWTEVEIRYERDEQQCAISALLAGGLFKITL